MNPQKCLMALSVLSAVVSAVLYGVLLFQSTDIIEFQYAQILLFFAEAFLLLAAVFAIGFAAVHKKLLSFSKIKKIIIALVCACLAACVVVTGCGWLTCYNCYTPENLLKNDKAFVQQFLPYQNILDDYSENTELTVSHIPGTDYISLYCYGTSEFGTPFAYKVEYFKSVSPFMNAKFRFEKWLASNFSVYDIDVVAPGRDMELDGTKLTVYAEGDNCAVLIKSFGRSVYASLINAPEGLTTEDFAKEIIKQFDLIDKAAKEKVFLNR